MTTSHAAQPPHRKVAERARNQTSTEWSQPADAIAHFVSGVTRDDVIGNDPVRSAVVQKLIVIEEAAAREEFGQQ